MYNQEIKEQFLNEVAEVGGRNKKSCHAIFEAIGTQEQLLCKDLSTMTEAEVVGAFRYVKARTYGSAFAVISLVRKYVKWCDSNNVFTNVNLGISKITVDSVDISEDIKGCVFIDEDEFVRELRLTRPFDDGYYDVVVMIFFWLGLSQKQMLNVKIDDVDFDNKIVRVGNSVIPLPDTLCEILKLYSKTKTGTRLNKGGPRTVYRDDSYDTFIRKFSPPNQLGKKITASQVEDAIYNLNKAYVELGNEPRFTGGNVLSSGALRRVRELELSGVDIFSIKNKDLVSASFRTGAKLHEILWLYRNYKTAFNL